MTQIVCSSRCIIGIYLALLAVTGQSLACTTSKWSSVQGDVSDTATAHFVGNCGLRVDLSGTAPARVEDATPAGLGTPVTEYAARFYAIDDNAVLSNGVALTLLAAVDSGDGDLFGVNLVGTSNGNALRIYAHNGTGIQDSTTVIAMPRGWRSLEIQWSAVAGTASLVLDGVADSITISGLSNSGQQVARVMLGAVAGNTTGASGSMDFDEFISRRTGTNGVVDKSCGTSGDSVVTVNNLTFLPGMKNCSASTSMSFGERVVFDSGSQVIVDSPVVVLGDGTHIPNGATFSVQ